MIGDLTYIKPTSSFKGFVAKTRIELPVVLEFWSVQETDNMPVSVKHYSKPALNVVHVVAPLLPAAKTLQ